MLMDSRLTNVFWTHAVHTTIHIQNIVILRNNNEKTHELWKGRPTNVKHFKVFGSKCYIKMLDENLGKFDARYDEGIFLGYASTEKTY